MSPGEEAKYERETNILWNELEKEVIIYTASRKEITKCKKAGYEIVHEDQYGVKFKCPKKRISFRSNKPSKPRKSKPLTEEHKQKLIEGKKRNKKQ